MGHAFHRPAGCAFVARVGRLAILAVALAVLPLQASATNGQGPLFRTVEAIEKSAAGPRHRIEVDRAAVEAAVRSGRLPVRMPDGSRFEAEVVRTETSATGVWTVVARVQTGLGWQSAVVSFGEDAVFGALPTPGGGIMRIATSQGRSVLERDGPLRPDIAAKAGGESQDIVRPPQPKAARRLLSDAEAEAIAKAGPVTIDVLGVYTTELVVARGSAAAVQAEFTNLFAVANQAYLDSGTVVRLNLVGFRETNHGQDIDNLDALEAIRSNALGDGLDVWAARDALRADLVAMLRSYNGGSSCGIAYVNGGGGYAEQPQPEYGYSVTNGGDGCSLYTMAHEIGHNLGSAHDRENSDHGDGAYLFSHGYRQPGPPAFSTVMAYRAGAWQERIGFFSHPGTTLCRGTACGVAEQSDNVRSLNLMAPRIALFRTPANTVAIHDGGVLEPTSGSVTSWHLVQLSSPAGPGGVTVGLSTADGTATAGQDYIARSEQLTIVEGRSTGHFAVQVLGDTSFEADETYLVNIDSVSSPFVAARAQGVGHIRATSLTVEDVRVAEGNYGTTTARFVVTLSQPLPVPVSFDIATVPGSGTATAGDDYITRSLVGQQIPAGETVYWFDVGIKTDLVTEAHESFQVRLSNVAGAVAPTSTANGRILNDDQQLSVADVSFVEGSDGWTTMTIPIRLSSASISPVRFNVDLTDASATEVLDYGSSPYCGPCELPAGETEFNYTFEIYGDRIDEGDEYFTLTLGEPLGASLGRRTATVFIDDDDGAAADVPLLVAGDARVVEGNAGNSVAPVVVSLSAPAPAGGVRFDLATSDGTATEGSDYQGVALTGLTIAAGQRSLTVDVPVTGDRVVEPDETFGVTVGNVAGAMLADGEAVVTVLNDDIAPPSISISDVSVAEGHDGETAMFFQATLSSPVQQIVHFNVVASDGTATGGSAADGHDYQLYVAHGGWMILPGHTSASIGVSAHGDLATEIDETFTLTLTDVVGVDVLDGQATGTILDDDRTPPPLQTRDDRVVVLENSSPTIIDVLDNDTFDPDRVAFGELEISQPGHGQVTVNDFDDDRIENDWIQYAPPPDFSGDTQFRYKLCETGRVRCVDGTVRIVVRPAADLDLQTYSGVGAERMNLRMLRAMPDALYRTTPLVAPTVSKPVLAIDPTPENAWDGSRDGTAYVNRTITEAEAGRDWRIVVDARGATGDVDLIVGTHSGSGGAPVASRTRCVAAMSRLHERCEMTLTFAEGGAQSYWVMVHNRDSGGQEATVEIFEVPLDAPSDGSLIVTGPRIVPADDYSYVLLDWNVPLLALGDSRLGFVEIQGGEGNWGMFPVRIGRTGWDAPAVALAGRSYDFILPAGMAQDRMFVDVPAGASSLTVTTASDSNVDLYLSFDPSPSIPRIHLAPARGSALASAVGATGNESLTVSGSQLKPGRWYVTPVNAGTTPATVSVQATITGVAPIVRAGSYFNAARSGHGLFLYPAGDSIAGLWYTFQDGPPTWYYLQGLKPGANGIWHADLYRGAWNGSTNTLTDIGSATVTPTGPDAFQFTYHLDGETGSEPLTALGRGCPMFEGNALDVSSHWFNPASPGPGYSVQLFPDYEFYTAFVFDGRGLPRFLVAESPRFAGTEATLDLELIFGFCPFCDRYMEPTRRKVGTLTRRFSGGGIGNISVDAIYGDLPGFWTRNEPLQPLGGPGTTQGCEP